MNLFRNFEPSPLCGLPPLGVAVGPREGPDSSRLPGAERRVSRSQLLSLSPTLRSASASRARFFLGARTRKRGLHNARSLVFLSFPWISLGFSCPVATRVAVSSKCAVLSQGLRYFPSVFRLSFHRFSDLPRGNDFLITLVFNGSMCAWLIFGVRFE